MTHGHQATTTGTTEAAGANLRRSAEGARDGAAGLGMRRALGLGLCLALVGAAAGCRKTSAQGQVAELSQSAGDPADANFAPVSGDDSYDPGQPARVQAQNVQYEPQQQGVDYGQQGAPIERRGPDSQTYQQNSDPGYDNGQYDTQEAADVYAADLTDAEANDPPPPLPDYDQPPAPDPDYLWTPGYWGWADGGYYWVPGTWVAAPYAGALWTPGYWGFYGGRYRFHHGFWGLHIGYYGGVDYGYGYVGHGYYGGYWDRGHFRYNTAVNRVDVHVIRNVYVHNVVVNNVVVNNRIVNRVSYVGGRGGILARPLAAEIAVLHEERRAPMTAQVMVARQAAQNRAQFYNQNHGRPGMVVNARPVVADRAPLTVLPRVNVPAGRQGWQGRQGGQQAGPSWQQQRSQQNGATVTPGQPQSQMRPAVGQAEQRGGWQQNGAAPQQPGMNHQPGQSGQQQVQPDARQGWQQQRQQRNGGGVPVAPAQGQAAQPQSAYRPGVSQTENRTAPVQPQQPVAPGQQPSRGWQQRGQENNGGRPAVMQPQAAPVQPQAAPVQPQQWQNRQDGAQSHQRPWQQGNAPQAAQPQQQQAAPVQPGWQQHRQNNDFRPGQGQPAAPVQARPQEPARPQPAAAEPRPQHFDAPRPQPQPQQAAPQLHFEVPPRAQSQPQGQPQGQGRRDGRENR